jgi:hypothetical protein
MMVIGGEVVDFIGDVAVFQVSKEAEVFMRRLREAIDLQITADPNTSTWSVRVRAYPLDQNAIRRFAQDNNSLPYAGEAVVFLDRGAVHACHEFDIPYMRSDAPTKVLPSWAKADIDQNYRSKLVFAGADPQ